ncbi:hypothetical protein QR680_002947 [Steinernema hermaphroditum]|uniref:Fork-head domain-containing protein n=1 Tax=Steinernema hermaphroditum TaxID=289476 RepID=A0AA39H5N6_9BILA|nr:hypothetical protein QR680_002947 [Steinernema hermaphroditum]
MEIATSPSPSHLIDSLIRKDPSLSPVPNVASTEPTEDVETSKKKAQCPKPAYAFSAIIALALKNSPDGRMPVWKIYAFILEHYPYYRTATEAWRNSVRHSLSKNGSFEKCPKEEGDKKDANQWRMIKGKESAVEKEIAKYRMSEKHHRMNLAAMNSPEILPKLEEGTYGIPPFNSEKEYKLAYNIMTTPKPKDFIRRPAPVEFSMSRYVFKDTNQNSPVKMETCTPKFEQDKMDTKPSIVIASPICSIISAQPSPELSVHPEEKRFYEKYSSSDINPLLSSAALPRSAISEMDDDSMLWETNYESFDTGTKFNKLDENDFWLPATMTSAFDLPADMSILSDAF